MTSDGSFPDVIKIPADHEFYQSSVDRASAVANGAHSAEGGPKEKDRKRIRLTRKVTRLMADPNNPNVVPVGPGAGMVGQSDPAVHPHRTHGAVQSHRLGEELLAQDIGEAAIEGIFTPVWAPLLGQFAVVPDVKTDIGTRQRMAPHRFQGMGELCGGAL